MALDKPNKGVAGTLRSERVQAPQLVCLSADLGPEALAQFRKERDCRLHDEQAFRLECGNKSDSLFELLGICWGRPPACRACPRAEPLSACKLEHTREVLLHTAQAACVGSGASSEAVCVRAALCGHAEAATRGSGDRARVRTES
eukprot:6128822-Pleurochrysis_carterae.AAC.2